MPDPGDTNSSFPAGGDFSSSPPTDPIQPLMNLSALNSRMDSLHDFLSDSIARNVLLGSHQMDMVSAEISSAIHQVILNGTALLSFSQFPNIPSPRNPNFPIPPNSSQPNTEERRSEPPDAELDDQDPKPDPDHEVIELDAVQILAEHVHFCQICGKGFKRDANLRMHMRAHGDQFKRPEALARPPSSASATLISDGKEATRFSCPFTGCNRNQRHRKFKPLKSVVCVRNHFKRSHCPKTYSCERCHKKSFSVLSDLRSHLKSCGESKWRCSCGTTFSRKDKLFGHMALFEGHMPAVGLDDDDKRLKIVDGRRPDSVAADGNGFRVDDELFDDEMLDEFAGINESCMQEMFGPSSSLDFAQQFCDI